MSQILPQSPILNNNNNHTPLVTHNTQILSQSPILSSPHYKHRRTVDGCVSPDSPSKSYTFCKQRQEQKITHNI
jgi:hypothetical protein